MKRVSMLMSLVVLGVLLAGGVALAANVQCETPEGGGETATCIGTPQNDRILGSEGDDDIRARQGDDFVSGFDGNDTILGGTGADKLKSNTGEDQIIPFAVSESDEEVRVVDDSDDIVNGGPEDDSLFGGFGQGGVDRVLGGGGNDEIDVAQRVYRAEGVETRITRESVNCGSGIDSVRFDAGIDSINTDNCESRIPIAPNGEPVEPPNGAPTAADFPSADELLEFAS